MREAFVSQSVALFPAHKDMKTFALAFPLAPAAPSGTPPLA